MIHRKYRVIAAVVFLATIYASLAYAACTTPPSGIVGWWPGDGSAGDLTGSTTTSFEGTFVPGQVGQAFSFDGNTQHLATSLDVQPSVMPETTWEAWVYPTRVLYSRRQTILSIDAGGYGRSVIIESGSSDFGVFTGNGVWKPAPVTLNAWQHIAVVYTATNILFYKDGVPSSLNQAPVPRASNYKLNIGRNPGYGEHFQGLVDEVSVYSRALAGNEIAAITSAATASKCKNPGSADLSIAQTVPTVTQIGRHLTNDIVVVNQGPDIALATHVAFTLPAGASVVASESGPGSWILATGQAGYALGDLNPGATATLRLVLNPTLAGSLTNALTVSSLAGDPNVANNTSVRETLVYRYYTPDDGDWDANSVMLYNTTEASLMVRSGDIDNLGFGWPAGFNPFSGNSTPGHTFPWAAPTNAPAGTDRIMVVSSYEGRPPKGQDGYTGSTSRPANEVEAVQLEYELGGIPVTSAALQLFVDDFQAPVWGASYTVRLNGVRAPFLETIINALAQTGPIGKLISANFPTEFLPLLLTNRLEILIDDTTTGAGDGFAIDFAKLLINVRVFGQVGTIQGQVVDSANQQPIPGVRVSAAGYAGATDTTGHYVLANIPAGLAPVEASHPDYIPQIKPTDLVTGNTNTVAFSLVVQPRLRVENHHGQAVISWPVSLSGYSLQTTPSLSPAASWVSEGTTPTVILERNTVTNSLADRQQFYRLSKP